MVQIFVNAEINTVFREPHFRIHAIEGAFSRSNQANRSGGAVKSQRVENFLTVEGNIVQTRYETFVVNVNFVRQSLRTPK